MTPGEGALTVDSPRLFTTVSGSRSVPGALWVPDHVDGPRPLVLVGHGGGANKAAVGPLAERLVVEHGFVVAAIDGPVHGDRRHDQAPPAVVVEEFRALWRNGDPRIDEMVADWHATLDYLVDLDVVDHDCLGWYGISAGTAYGLPFLASEPRLRAAVLGMWGLSYPSTQRLAHDAPLLRCPVLFQRKADDELFSVEGQEELFALIGSPDKDLTVYPGGHAVNTEQLSDTIAFLSGHLQADGSR